MPSLSGSDQAIGALRIKRERPSRRTGPYRSRRTNPVSDTCRVPPSVSSDRLLDGTKSPGRCENCVAEKRSRCSRDLPSCTRCHKKGLLCFYADGVPTGRRKLQKTRVRSRIREGKPGLSLESSLIVPASEDLAPLDTEEMLAARRHRPDTHSTYGISERPLPSLDKYPATPRTGSPMDSPPARSFESSQYETIATNEWITDTSPHRTGKLETASGITMAESLRSQWGTLVAGGSNPGLVQGV